MNTLDVCRVCLQAQAPLFNILDSPLHAMFEKLTDMKVDLSDRSHVLCMLCHSHLKNAFRLYQRAQKSEEYLLSLLPNNAEIVKDIKFHPPQSLCRSKTKVSYFNGHTINDKPVETEVLNRDQIKEESTIEVTCLTAIKDEPADTVSPSGEDNKTTIEVTCFDGLMKTVKDEPTEIEVLLHEPVQNVCTTTFTNCYDVMINYDSLEVTKEEVDQSVDRDESKASLDPSQNSTDSDDEESLMTIKKRKRQEISQLETLSLISLLGMKNKSRMEEGPKDGQTSKDDTIDTIINNMDTSRKKAELQPFVTCSYCDRKFTHKWELTKHFSQHTGEKPYSCSYCDRQFAQKWELTRHLRVHTGEKPYPCSYCDRKFRQKCDLTRHLRVHTGEKPYACTYCDRQFAQKSDLTKHSRIHTGERPYTCTYCDFKFTQKGHLTDHLRIHTGERPFSCNYCDYKCQMKSSLTKHLKIHTGGNLYPCSYCDRKFLQKQNLTEHLSVHTGENLFPCKYCDRKFTVKADLTKHIKMHTGDK